MAFGYGDRVAFTVYEFVKMPNGSIGFREPRGRQVGENGKPVIDVEALDQKETSR